MGPLILGASGRVGRALARVWAGNAPVWQYRAQGQQSGESLIWDILHDPAPPLPKGISGIIVLAGVTGRDPETLALNTALARAACRLAREAGIARILIASSQAVYGAVPGLVGENNACAPTNPYGVAKLAMEQAVADEAGVTCLRFGNIAGCDSLFQLARQRPVMLDQFADGQSARRSYIGPVTLARVLHGLLDATLALPRVLNVASPGVVTMQGVLQAAGVPFQWQAAPATALAELELDVGQLTGLMPLPNVSAQDIVAEAEVAGWSAG